MTLEILLTWLVAFALTYTLEAAVYQLPLTASSQTKSRRQRLLDCLMINACTHPFVFLVLPLLLDESAPSYVIVAEVFAIIAEAFFLAKFGYQKPWLLSVTANVVSWLFGSWLLYGVLLAAGSGFRFLT